MAKLVEARRSAEDLKAEKEENIRRHDEDGVCAEPFPAFPEDPMSFEEMAAALREDLWEVYALSGRLNRFSRKYPAVCRLLEQLIKRMAGCLVTKAALEQNGFRFPTLNDMTIEELYGMVSYHFRKTHSAFQEGKTDNGCADIGLLDQECRLMDLAERLKSTEERVRNIKAGKVDVEALLERAKMYKDSRKRTVPAKPDNWKTNKAYSLPLITSVVSELLRQRKEKDRQDAMIARVLGGRMIPPARLQDYIDKDAGKNTRPEEKAPAHMSEVSQKPKDNSAVQDAVAKMLNSRPKVRTEKDLKLDKEVDETMRRVFEKRKKMMEAERNSKPGRV